MSSSEDFEAEQTDRQNAFFSDLFVGSLLSAKNSAIRKQIAKNSEQNYKSRSLNEKIESVQSGKKKLSPQDKK